MKDLVNMTSKDEKMEVDAPQDKGEPSKLQDTQKQVEAPKVDNVPPPPSPSKRTGSFLDSEKETKKSKFPGSSKRTSSFLDSEKETKKLN